MENDSYYIKWNTTYNILRQENSNMHYQIVFFLYFCLGTLSPKQLVHDPSIEWSFVFTSQRLPHNWRFRRIHWLENSMAGEQQYQENWKYWVMGKTLISTWCRKTHSKSLMMHAKKLRSTLNLRLENVNLRIFSLFSLVKKKPKPLFSSIISVYKIYIIFYT